MKCIENYGVQELTSFELANIDGGDKFMKDLGDFCGSVIGGIVNFFERMGETASNMGPLYWSGS